jgi:threonine/homoserine/homoserine lactone efflux protein
MSISSMLMVAATALLVFLLPSPCGRLLRDHIHARGRLRALLLLPGIWLGYVAAAFCAGAAYLALQSTLAAMVETFAWVGLVVLMIFIMRSQQRRFVHRMADNDNLTPSGALRSIAQVVVESGRPGLVLALLAIFLQTAESAVSPVQFLAAAGIALLPSLLLAPLLQLLIAETVAKQMLRARRRSQASRKPRTRFIASRAVTAGYRRIAA